MSMVVAVMEVAPHLFKEYGKLGMASTNAFRKAVYYGAYTFLTEFVSLAAGELAPVCSRSIAR